MERLNRNAPALLLAAAFAAATVVTLVLASKMTFYADTWELLINRRDPSVDTLLQPHNEHLIAIPVLIAQLCLRLFGMTSAMPEYVILTLALLGTAALLFVYVKRRVGPWPALFAAVLLLFLGPAWEVLLWPFEITFVGPVLCGLAMLLALEREDRRGDAAACLFLVVSLGFSSLALPFVVGAAVAILQSNRRDWPRRAYVVGVPVLLFALWYVGWGHDADSQRSLHNVLVSPRFVLDSIAVSVSALFGFSTGLVSHSLGVAWKWAALVALVAALGYRLWKKPGFSPGLWPVVAVAATNWFLTAFNASAGRDPGASRYQYVGAVFVLMILANLLQGIQLSRRTLWIAAAVTLASVGANLASLKQGGDNLQQQALLTRSGTAAIEIARGSVDPGFQLNPELVGTSSLINVFAGPYLEAVDEYGSPAYSPAELDSGPEQARRRTDLVLSQALPLSTVTHLGAYGAGGGREGCVAVTPGGTSGPGLPLAPGLTRIEVAPGPHAGFSLRRFAIGEYPVATEGAAGGSVTVLRIPRDSFGLPWRLRLQASQPTRVCR
jgi:hypothetical protein